MGFRGLGFRVLTLEPCQRHGAQVLDTRLARASDFAIRLVEMFLLGITSVRC